MRVAVVIPSYNGRELLARNLPGVVAAARRAGADVTVADDCSDDGTSRWLQESHPEVKALPSSSRLGFARNCNRAFAASDADVIVLLNSDVEVEADFIAPLVGHFGSREDLFAVAPSVISEGQGGLDEAVNFFTFRQGLLDAAFPCLAGAPAPSHPTPIGFGVGAAVALHRGKLLQLSGFDTVYAPYYCEDADLGYRAWRRGWATLYEPRGRVRHQYQGTIGATSSRAQVRSTLFRNKLILTWRNLRDRDLWVRHLLWIPRLPVSHLRHRRWPELRGTLAAYAQAPRILGGRSTTTGGLKDREILSCAMPTAPP